MIPPLSELRTFVEAARAESFTRAARAVHITQGAVSRQMRELEGQLGTQLFVRRARAVTLTPEGRAYLADIEQALAIIERATGSVAQGGKVVVSLLPSFASLWLLPHLPRFEACHPEVCLELEPSYELADLHGGKVHVAIRYGLGAWPGVVTRPIFAETLVPVVSPTPACELRGGDFWRLPLLSAGASGPDSEGDIDWQAWAEGAGETIRAGVVYRRLRDYQRVLYAARAGQGVAIARTRLLGAALEASPLVPVSDFRVTGRTGHYFLASAAHWETPAVQTFFRWLNVHAHEMASRLDP